MLCHFRIPNGRLFTIRVFKSTGTLRYDLNELILKELVTWVGILVLILSPYQMYTVFAGDEMILPILKGGL